MQYVWTLKITFILTLNEYYSKVAYLKQFQILANVKSEEDKKISLR
jgi:hypothetical protein